MANSLRAKLSKLRHDGHITDAEYQAFIKKMDGHDAEIKSKVIDDFAERLRERVTIVFDNGQKYLNAKWIDKIAEELKGGAE